MSSFIDLEEGLEGDYDDVSIDHLKTTSDDCYTLYNEDDETSQETSSAVDDQVGESL